MSRRDQVDWTRFAKLEVVPGPRKEQPQFYDPDGNKRWSSLKMNEKRSSAIRCQPKEVDWIEWLQRFSGDHYHANVGSRHLGTASIASFKQFIMVHGSLPTGHNNTARQELEMSRSRGTDCEQTKTHDIFRWNDNKNIVLNVWSSRFVDSLCLGNLQSFFHP